MDHYSLHLYAAGIEGIRNLFQIRSRRVVRAHPVSGIWQERQKRCLARRCRFPVLNCRRLVPRPQERHSRSLYLWSSLLFRGSSGISLVFAEKRNHKEMGIIVRFSGISCFLLPDDCTQN